MNLLTIRICLLLMQINQLQFQFLQIISCLSGYVQNLCRSFRINSRPVDSPCSIEVPHPGDFPEQSSSITTISVGVVQGGDDPDPTSDKLGESFWVHLSTPSSHRCAENGFQSGLLALRVGPLLRRAIPSTLCVKHRLFESSLLYDFPLQEQRAEESIPNPKNDIGHHGFDLSIDEKQPRTKRLNIRFLNSAASVADMIDLGCIQRRRSEGISYQRSYCYFDSTKRKIASAKNHHLRKIRLMSRAGSLSIQEKPIDLVFKYSPDKRSTMKIKKADAARNRGVELFIHSHRSFPDLRRHHTNNETNRNGKKWRILDDFQDLSPPSVDFPGGSVHDLTRGYFVQPNCMNSIQFREKAIQANRCQGFLSILTSENLDFVRPNNIKEIKDCFTMNMSILKKLRCILVSNLGKKQAFLRTNLLPKYQIRYGMNADVVF